MKTLRRLSYVALAIAFLQIVFGAIVRITGSGWGCAAHRGTDVDLILGSEPHHQGSAEKARRTRDEDSHGTAPRSSR